MIFIPFGLHRIFSASLECFPSYKTTDKIECQFHLKNNRQQDYSVLKWHTPLEELTSDCLSVTRNGVQIPYDGTVMKRETPGPDEFVLVVAGQTVSRKFDVSKGYEVNRAGTYSLAVDTYLEYAVGSVKSMNEPGKPAIPIKISHLSSPAVSFKVVGRKASNGTPGQRARSLERENKRIIQVGNSQKRVESSNIPLDPVVEGNAAQKAETKEVHRASYHYIKAAISDLQSSPDRVETWFGTQSSDFVLEKFKLMERLLRTDTITYAHDCTSGPYAYTWKGSREIHFCRAYENSEIFAGYDTKMSTIVHELAHALAYVDDIAYGYSACKTLANSHPNSAAMNADNYNYFVATLFPFNYGFDAMTTLSNGYIYLFKGNMYVRYTDGSASILDPAYPMLIQGSWGILPDNFAQGFDSFLYIEGNGKAYATKGSQYIRYSDESASTVDSGYPLDIATNWGVSGDFSAGFDSMTQLSNGKTYVTKGSSYVRYSNNGLYPVDEGYPSEFGGNWGSLPENFKSGFDAMTVFPNGKIYVFRGSQYIRYSDNTASQVDDGYPLPIKGNWGNVPQ